jgi:hypothetical protein
MEDEKEDEKEEETEEEGQHCTPAAAELLVIHALPAAIRADDTQWHPQWQLVSEYRGSGVTRWCGTAPWPGLPAVWGVGCLGCGRATTCWAPSHPCPRRRRPRHRCRRPSLAAVPASTAQHSTASTRWLCETVPYRGAGTYGTHHRGTDMRGTPCMSAHLNVVTVARFLLRLGIIIISRAQVHRGPTASASASAAAQIRHRTNVAIRLRWLSHCSGGGGGRRGRGPQLRYTRLDVIPRRSPACRCPVVVVVVVAVACAVGILVSRSTPCRAEVKAMRGQGNAARFILLRCCCLLCRC